MAGPVALVGEGVVVHRLACRRLQKVRSGVREQTQIVAIQKRDRLHGSVRHLAGRGRPGHLAVVDLERDDPLVALATGMDDDDAAVDTWRTGKAPHRRLRALCRRLEVGFPLERPVDGTQTHEDPLGPERIDRPVGKRRRAARPEPAERFEEPRRGRVRPDRLAGLRVVARHDFVFEALLLREQPIGADGKRAPRRTDPFAPHLARRMGDPIVAEPKTGLGTVTARPAEMGPGRRSEGRDQRLGVDRTVDCDVSSSANLFRRQLFRGWLPAPVESEREIPPHAVGADEGRVDRCQNGKPEGEPRAPDGEHAAEEHRANSERRDRQGDCQHDRQWPAHRRMADHLLDPDNSDEPQDAEDPLEPAGAAGQQPPQHDQQADQKRPEGARHPDHRGPVGDQTRDESHQTHQRHEHDRDPDPQGVPLGGVRGLRVVLILVQILVHPTCPRVVDAAVLCLGVTARVAASKTERRWNRGKLAIVGFAQQPRGVTLIGRLRRACPPQSFTVSARLKSGSTSPTWRGGAHSSALRPSHPGYA